MSKPSRYKLYYIRHGETDWNAEGRVQGGIDVPLNERGRKQASEAGMILRDLIAQDGYALDELDYVSSPLTRARTTMDLVRPCLGLSVEGYRLDDRLREISYGDWEGLTYSEMQQRDPALYAKRSLDKWGTPPPGGEAYAVVAPRLNDWYAGLGRNTVAVAHGGTMRTLMAELGVAPPLDAANFNVIQGVVYVFSGGVMTRYA